MEKKLEPMLGRFLSQSHLKAAAVAYYGVDNVRIHRAKGKELGTLEVRCVHHPVSKIKAAERKRKRAFTGVCVIMFSVFISTVRRIVCPTMFLVSLVALGRWWAS